MRKNAVAWAEFHLRCRNIYSVLSKQKRKSDRLSNSGFTATVRTCQNVNSPVIVKINIVCDNIQIFTVCRFYAEFEVVNISKTTVSVLFRQNFCLAQRKIFLFHLITKLCKTNIKNDFGHKRNERVAVDIDISVEH